MVTLRCKLTVHARTVDMRRVGVKVRTYENVRVFLKGTAGSKQHWALKEFEKCVESDAPLMYFSGTRDRAYIAVHGNHVHVFARNSSGKLDVLDHETAIQELEKFLGYLRSRGIRAEVKWNGNGPSQSE